MTHGHYGYVIVWGTSVYHVHGFDTPAEAREAAEDWARSEGWTPRRWWQLWRLGDSW